MLFSIVFRTIATSTLAPIALWIFFSFFVSHVATPVANAVAPLRQFGGDSETLIRHTRIQKAVTLISPMELYSDPTATLIDPMRKTTRSLVLMGPLERLPDHGSRGPFH